MKGTITIKWEYFPDIAEEDSSQAVVAWIEELKGYVVSGATVGEAVKELGISMIVMEQYKLKKYQQPQP